MAPLTALCARETAAEIPKWAEQALSENPSHLVGRRPGKEIDPYLTSVGERLMVIGDDGDLAAVVLRLLRLDLLTKVMVGYVPLGPSDFAAQWGLPSGPRAVRLAVAGEVDVVPVIRDDVGGILLGRATLSPLDGPVFVDEYRLWGTQALALVIEPDAKYGVLASVIRRRILGVFDRVPTQQAGRAVQIGTKPAVLVADGVRRGRPVTTWTYYRHTQPLRLIRGALD